MYRWCWFCPHLFSPRARGCSLIGAVVKVLAAVFPACAGMFLSDLRKA